MIDIAFFHKGIIIQLLCTIIAPQGRGWRVRLFSFGDVLGTRL